MFSLEDLGWSPFFEPHIGPTTEDLIIARVAEEQRGAYLLFSERGELAAAVTGRMMHEAEGRDAFPAVGDWVLARPLAGEERAVIVSTLPRRTKLSRKAAGERTDEQILAANVDTVFLVASLNRDLNIRRIERYLSVIWESGAKPVIVLNKADIAEDREELMRDVESAVMTVEVHMTSAATGEGIGAIAAYVGTGRTVVFVGSSGVGKSSLVNRLLDREEQAVHEIRSDGKGRHTTTSREMLFVPGGGLIIDTPGLRELQLWDAESGVGQVFSDIESLFAACAFSDCGHRSEPGCAVRAALVSGGLDRARWESYQKLQREQEFIESRKDASARVARQKKWKDITKANRQRMKVIGK